MNQFSAGNSDCVQTPSADEPTDLLCLLMEGIGRQTIDEDSEELARFLERIAAETARLKQAADASQRRAGVEAALQMLAHHNDAVRADYKAHSAELTSALRIMTETIAFLGKSSQAAVHQLGIIGSNLERATASDDVKSLRLRLGACLKMIREQSESLQAQTAEQLNQLKEFVASSALAPQLGLAEEPLDTVTGLPSRSFAENLIQERFARKTECLVGVIRINRLTNFLSRYGQTAVDDVTRSIARQLAPRLPVGSILCRWSQNSFIAITEVTSSFSETAQQWNRVGSPKVEKSIGDGARTAYVVLTTSITLEQLLPSASKRQLIQNIERFAAPQANDLAA